jgi:hypothetical protein
VGTSDLRPSSRTWWDHLRIRAGARRRQANAERRLNRAGSDMQKDLRAPRRDATTAATVGRSKLANGAARTVDTTLTRLVHRYEPPIG